MKSNVDTLLNQSNHSHDGRALKAEAKRLAWTNQVRRCQAIPGVGPLSALAIVVTYHRGQFRSADAFIAFMGMDIRVRDSGKFRGRPKFTKKGVVSKRHRLQHGFASWGLRFNIEPILKPVAVSAIPDCSLLMYVENPGWMAYPLKEHEGVAAMTNATVLIGLIGNADFEDANGIVSKACSVAGIDLLPQDLESLEGHQCTTIGFEDIASAEKLVKQLFMQCDKRDFGADIGYAFVLVFAAGDPDDSNIALVRIFGELDARTNAQAQVIETQVYVTLEFYRQLSPSQQDQYKPSVVVANSHVHERYGPDTMKCFVISPIGEEGSEKRQRVDNVFNTYIKPACDSTEFMAIRGDRMVGLNIMEDIKHALQTWPMAIAYLGDLREGINENVVFELGQRTAMELPVVLLRDRWSPEEDADDFASQLPFDLRQFRCVGLPPKEEEDLKDAVASGKVAGIIRTIRLHLQREQTSEAGWKSPFPFATFGVQENRCWCLDGSPDLADFYAIPNPIGKDLDDILPRLMERMPKSQREPFLHDQRIILTNISLHFPTALRTNELVPKIPIVFDEHPRYRGRKFLPLLFRYATTGNLVKLRVGYVDVTKAAQRNQDEVYTCDLSGSLNTSMEGPVPSE